MKLTDIFRMRGKYSIKSQDPHCDSWNQINSWPSISKLTIIHTYEQEQLLQIQNDMYPVLSSGLQQSIKRNRQAQTDKGKAAQQKKLDDLLAFFSQKNQNSLKLMFDLQKYIVLAKLKLINILNKLSNINTFVKTRTGYKTTGPEGYVAIDKLGGDAVKIVDRMEFSYNNFSPDILKGWDKPGKN